jgi:hypothetical protein
MGNITFRKLKKNLGIFLYTSRCGSKIFKRKESSSVTVFDLENKSHIIAVTEEMYIVSFVGDLPMEDRRRESLVEFGQKNHDVLLGWDDKALISYIIHPDKMYKVLSTMDVCDILPPRAFDFFNCHPDGRKIGQSNFGKYGYLKEEGGVLKLLPNPKEE